MFPVFGIPRSKRGKWRIIAVKDGRFLAANLVSDAAEWIRAAGDLGNCQTVERERFRSPRGRQAALSLRAGPFAAEARTGAGSLPCPEQGPASQLRIGRGVVTAA